MGTTIALATSHLVPSSHVSQQINHHPVPLMSYYLCLQRASGWRLNFSLAPFPSVCLLPVECGFFGFAPSVKDGLTASCKYSANHTPCRHLPPNICFFIVRSILFDPLFGMRPPRQLPSDQRMGLHSANRQFGLSDIFCSFSFRGAVHLPYIIALVKRLKRSYDFCTAPCTTTVSES